MKDPAGVADGGYFLLVFHQPLADQPTEVIVCQPQLAKGLDLDGKIPRIAAQLAGEIGRFGQIAEGCHGPRLPRMAGLQSCFY